MPVLQAVAAEAKGETRQDYNAFLSLLNKEADQQRVKLSSKRLNLIKNHLAFVDENAAPVIKKIHRGGKVGESSLYGFFPGDGGTVEYEPDTNLRDTEQVPLLHPGGIEAFFKDEVLTFAPDAWIDQDKTQIGYEISFTKYFYKPVKLRSLAEIVADIKALEAETDGLLNEIIGG